MASHPYILITYLTILTMKDTLQALVTQPGVSGYELAGGISAGIKELLQNNDDITVSIDELGNVLARKGSGGKHILLEAHLDEVGFFITQIITNTQVRVLPVGSIKAEAVVGQKIVINGQKGILQENFWVQIEDAKKLSVGDVGHFMRTARTKGDLFFSPALDNRVGCTMALEVLKSYIPKNSTLTVLFSTQHEQGSTLGLYPKVKELEVDCVLILDAAYAQPQIGVGWSVPVLGRGPAIQLMGNRFIVNEKMVRIIREVAVEHDIPLQWEIPSRDTGGTDASKLPNNLLFGVINVPVADQHTGKSSVSLDDLVAAKELVSKVVEKLS